MAPTRSCPTGKAKRVLFLQKKKKKEKEKEDEDEGKRLDQQKVCKAQLKPNAFFYLLAC